MSNFQKSVFLAITLTALFACKGKATRTPDDTIVMLIERPVQDLDPRFPNTSIDIKVSRLVAAALVTMDQPNMVPRMDLAESIENPEPTIWIAKLAPGRFFSDGTPVSADDVVYTYNSVLDPKLNSFLQSMYRERIKEVRAIDNLTIRFELNKPFATFMTDLDLGILSAAKMKNLLGQRTGDGSIVGAGPYRVVKRNDLEVILEANPHHPNPPRLPKVIFRTVRDPNARLLLMVGGSADLMLNGLSPTLKEVVESKERLVVEQGPSAILTYLMFQTEHPILGKVKVRQALAYAIDRDLLIRTKIEGLAQLATGLLPPPHWGYNPDVASYRHDQEKARQLLEESGYPLGEDGGPRFSLIFKTSADPYRLAMARLIAQQLRAVDIAVEVRSFDFHTFFADVKAGNFELGFMQTSAIIEPDNYTRYFHSSKVPTKENPNLGNRWRYNNPRIDQLVDQGRHALDQAGRIKAYHEIQEILANELPILPLWHEDNLLVRNRRVRGFEVLPNARFYSLTQVTKGQ